MNSETRTQVREMAFDMFEQATAAGKEMCGADVAAVAEAAFKMAMRMTQKGETAEQARERVN